MVVLVARDVFVKRLVLGAFPGIALHLLAVFLLGVLLFTDRVLWLVLMFSLAFSPFFASKFLFHWFQSFECNQNTFLTSCDDH